MAWKKPRKVKKVKSRHIDQENKQKKHFGVDKERKRSSPASEIAQNCVKHRNAKTSASCMEKTSFLRLEIWFVLEKDHTCALCFLIWAQNGSFLVQRHFAFADRCRGIDRIRGNFEKKLATLWALLRQMVRIQAELQCARNSTKEIVFVNTGWNAIGTGQGFPTNFWSGLNEYIFATVHASEKTLVIVHFQANEESVGRLAPQPETSLSIASQRLNFIISQNTTPKQTKKRRPEAKEEKESTLNFQARSNTAFRFIPTIKFLTPSAACFINNLRIYCSLFISRAWLSFWPSANMELSIDIIEIPGHWSSGISSYIHASPFFQKATVHAGADPDIGPGLVWQRSTSLQICKILVQNLRIESHLVSRESWNKSSLTIFVRENERVPEVGPSFGCWSLTKCLALSLSLSLAYQSSDT